VKEILALHPFEEMPYLPKYKIIFLSSAVISRHG